MRPVRTVRPMGAVGDVRVVISQHQIAIADLIKDEWHGRELVAGLNAHPRFCQLVTGKILCSLGGLLRSVLSAGYVGLSL